MGPHKSHKGTSVTATCFTCMFYILEFPHRFHLGQKDVSAPERKVWQPAPNFIKKETEARRECTQVHIVGKLQSSRPLIRCSLLCSVMLLVIL